MPMPGHIQQYLERMKVPYELLSHPEAYRASKIAQMLETPENQLAKTVMVYVDGRIIMTVLPAARKLDLHRLREIFCTNHVRLANEEEFKDFFPDCDIGAMPPFGNLYGLEVYVDRELTQHDVIVFHAGTHSEALRMRYVDFAELVHPVLAEFHGVPSRLAG